MPINPCRNAECEYFNKTLPIDAKNCPFCGEPLGNIIEAIRNDKRVPRLKLIHSSGQEFYLPGEMGYIGRGSSNNPIAPEIDLRGLPHDTIVSRGAHAYLSWSEEQKCYVIFDKDSRNGTFLNGVQLKPNVPYPLQANSTLQLGQDGLVTLKVWIS